MSTDTVSTNGSRLTLDQLPMGGSARIIRLTGESSRVVRLMEMGFLEGETLQMTGVAPLGDPIAILIRGCRLALRRREAALIEVEVLATSGIARCAAGFSSGVR